MCRDVLVDHSRKLGTPTADETFDAEFDKEINAWAEVNADASDKEGSGSEGLQRLHKGRSKEVCS